MAKNKIHVLVRKDDEGGKLNLCVTTQFPIDGAGKDKLRETFNLATHYTESIIVDDYLLELYGEDALREEFCKAVDDLANGKTIEYNWDEYEWQEIELI